MISSMFQLVMIMHLVWSVLWSCIWYDQLVGVWFFLPVRELHIHTHMHMICSCKVLLLVKWDVNATGALHFWIMMQVRPKGSVSVQRFLTCHLRMSYASVHTCVKEKKVRENDLGMLRLTWNSGRSPANVFPRPSSLITWQFTRQIWAEFELPDAQQCNECIAHISLHGSMPRKGNITQIRTNINMSDDERDKTMSV